MGEEKKKGAKSSRGKNGEAHRKQKELDYQKGISRETGGEGETEEKRKDYFYGQRRGDPRRLTGTLRALFRRVSAVEGRKRGFREKSHQRNGEEEDSQH